METPHVKSVFIYWLKSIDHKLVTSIFQNKHREALDQLDTSHQH